MCIKRTGKYIIALFVVGLSLAISTVAQACCICDGHLAFRHYTKYVYTPIDSEYHEYASHWSGTCVNCQGRWYLACQPNGEPRREKHSYYSWGECKKCGYTQSSGSTATPKPTVTSTPGTCPPHTPITEYLYTTYTPANDSKHDVLLHNKVTCSACGTVISPDQVETQWAIHNFGSGSTCLDCGYSKAGYYMSVDQGHINGLAAYVGGGQGATINVTSNVEWTAVPDVNWIHIDNWTGSGNGSFSVSVDANTGYAREGHILVVGTHGASIDIKVSQEGAIVDPATCAHDYGYDYYSATDSKWVSLGSDEHQRIELYYTYVCTICGHTYQDWGSDVEEVIEAHTFGETSWTRWMSNETQHARNGKKTCTAPGCGYVKDVKETGAHTFVNGKCICGKKAPSWQKVWTHVDKNMPEIKIKLDSTPLYLFEFFVEEYRESTYEQAWTAALSSVDIAKETLPEALKVIEGRTEDLVALFSSDEKVARLIIDYLATSDFSALLESHEGMSELQGVFEFVEEPLSYLDIKYATVRSVETQTEFVLGDLMNITDENCKDVYKQLMSIRNGNGTVDFSDPSIVELVYVDTSCKLGDRVQEKLGRMIEEAGEDTYIGEIPGSPGRKILTAGEVVSYILTPVLSGVDAYVEFAKYQAVLDQYESDLTAILEGAGSDNAKHIIKEVMDTLTETVVDGLVLSIEKEMFADTAAATIEIVADVSFIPLAVVDVETMILGIAANTSETFGKVWSVEDLYSEFQTAEKNLLNAVKTFHSAPSDETYSQLEAELAYYSLLVGSGANAVSSILINDAEAPINRFKNWVGGFFDGVKVDYRIEQIEYANKLPAEDQATLNGVKTLIIP